MPSAFVWDPGRTLEFLDHPVGEAPIANRPLAAHQDDALGPPSPTRVRSLGDIPADARDYLLVGAHVFLTRRIARRFREAARRSGAATAVLAIEPCIYTRSTGALSEVRVDGERAVYDVWYRGAAGPPTEAELAAATLVPLAIREHKLPNDMLERREVRPEGMDVALTTEAVLHVRHWSHLVVANYVALFCLWFDLTPAKVIRYLGAVLRAGIPTRHRIMRTLTVRGRRCNIHPTAVVEASVLGDDVEIGPFAVVRGALIGNRVKIDSHANVNFSSIGDNAVVSFHTTCNLSVLYPQAMLNFIGAQMAVLGRRATVLSGCFLMDLRDPYLEREVVVEDAGRRVPSGRKLLGPLVGHDTILGAGVTVAAGTVVPNGAFLIGDPSAVFRRFEGEIEPRVPLQAIEGRAAMIKREK